MENEKGLRENQLKGRCLGRGFRRIVGTYCHRKETEKAVSVVVDNIHYIRYKGEEYSENEYEALSPMRTEAWLPKSQITLTAEYIELPDWLVQKKGLKYFIFEEEDEIVDIKIKVKDEEEFAEDRDMFLQEYPDSTLFA